MKLHNELETSKELRLRANAGIQRRGLMIVLSSPSGAGKTTIARAILERDPNITLSVSCTTRQKRPDEKDGSDYFFVSDEEFKDMLEKGQFLESAKVFGRSYGTPRAFVEERISQGKDVLFDIDWQGTQQLSSKMHEDIVSIFILPPSGKELERRLRARASDHEEEIQNRMNKAADEISHWAEYDYVIVNSDIDRSIKKVESIILSERFLRRRQTGLSTFVSKIMTELEK